MLLQMENNELLQAIRVLIREEIQESQQPVLQRLDGVEASQQRVEKRLDGVEAGLQELREDVVDLQQGMGELRQDVGVLKETVSVIEGQLRENTDYIKAALHNQAVFKAQLDGLTVNTATREHVGRLEAKFDNLNIRLFDQEAEITQLKAVR